MKTMGTIVDDNYLIKYKNIHYTDMIAVPASFDSRENWEYCSDVIGTVRDQSNCGSCWAFGTTEAFNDRECIKTKGAKKTLLSTADTTACCSFFSCYSMGCNGGQIGTPWTWFHNKGVVSGAGLGDKKTCYPYTMPKCNHHVSGPYKDCSDVTQVAPECGTSCPGNQAT